MNIYKDAEPDALLSQINVEWKTYEVGLPNRVIFTCVPAHTGITYRFAAHEDVGQFLIRVWSGFLNNTIRIVPESPEEADALFDAVIVPDETQKTFGTIRLLFLKNVIESVPANSSSSSSAG